MKNLKIPFNFHGHMMNWAAEEYPNVAPPPPKDRPWILEDSVAKWRDDQPFEDTLRLLRLERGRSAAKFIFVSETTGTEYTMFGQWLVDALLKGGTDKGRIKGKWGFAKRGANYSIEFLGA